MPLVFALAIAIASGIFAICYAWNDGKYNRGWLLAVAWLLNSLLFSFLAGGYFFYASSFGAVGVVTFR